MGQQECDVMQNLCRISQDLDLPQMDSDYQQLNRQVRSFCNYFKFIEMKQNHTGQKSQNIESKRILR